MGRRQTAYDESDGSIVRRVVAGDVNAFELLIDRHSPRVRRLVARNVPGADAAEVAHDTFVAAYLSLPSFVESHPFEHWLTRIALRRCAGYWRSRGRDAHAGAAADIDTQADKALTPAMDDRELCEWALARLEHDDRNVLTLVYFEALSVKECAEVLSWSESKVKVRVHRARAHLRRILLRVLSQIGRP